MLKPWPKQQSHEELFVEQYGQLFRWSLKLTGNDSALAEDLLHDVYVQFTLARPDLSTVQNPSAYLYTMLRNRFLSHVRRRAASPISNLAAIDYDCAEIGFLDCDPRERMRVAEELDAICDFACTRKEASKTGSVLILRFFQGYYPAEMAAIMVLSRQSVDTWVRMARTETRAFLQDPSTFKLAGLQPQQSAHSGTGAHAGAATGGEVLGYLREKIFLSRQGKCPGGNVLKSLLTAGSSDPLPTRILAHISSCFECLDFASGMLGLPGPAGRHPNDTFGPDSRWKGGSGTGAGLDSALVKPRRKSRQVFEHSPKKLAVSVNGFAIGSQTVGSELSELTLAVNVDERIGFVEVFSEQNILLLQLDVEPPPEGPVEQSATVALSCDRFLTTSISFASAWPELRLVYRDPEYQSEADLGFLLNGQEAVEQETRNLPELKGDVVAASLGPPANQAWISRLRRVLFPSSFWLRPGTITAALAVLLVVALVLVRTPGPAVSAADLLRKVSASERAALSQPGKVVHRTLSLEEENLARPAAIVHRKVDVWHSASPINGTVEARRVYDDHGTLIGEDFTRGDGSQILKGLSEPSAPQNNTAGMPAEPLLNPDDIWRLQLSAEGFSALCSAGDLSSATVRTNGDDTEVTVPGAVATRPADTVPGAVATGSRLLSAQLKIRKSDQRSIAETLVIARGGDRWRYRISEAAFLLLNAADAPRSEFDADRLPGHALEGSARSSNERVLPQRNGLPDNVSPAAVASADLEVEVTYLLDQVKANLGEQISVTRTAGGKLLVQGIVDSDKRKAQIVQALAEVSSNPAVRLDILTVAEAMHRRTQAESPGAVRRVEVNGSATIPVYGRLRSHFEKSGIASEQIDDQIKKFAAAALSDSREALRHAWALKRLAQEFSPEELQSLGPEARARRGQMIIEHARSARDELAKLSQQLGQVFGLQRPTAEAFPVTGDGAVSNEIAELTDSISAIDESVRSDFTVTAGSASSSSVDSAGFWRQLDKAQKLAESIRNRTK